MSCDIKTGALVLYKQTPAVVLGQSEKLELSFPDGRTKKVREKDIQPLHEGPVESLRQVVDSNMEVDLDEAWELLQGETTTLADLTELVLGETSPEAIWAVFREFRASDCFDGTVDEITPLPEDEVRAKRERKAERERMEREWREHIERLRSNSWDERDINHLKEVERFACGLASSNRTLKGLKIPSTKEKAHELLLRLGVWSDFVNPHPMRAGCPLEAPRIEVPSTSKEKRLDLTHLASFAVDDDGCEDPDDAIGVDGDAIWVHVADPASVATPGSAVDLEARDRGANVYLPERVVKMLPEEMTRRFGLGLSGRSPALSFKIVIGDDGEPRCETVTLSTIAAEMVSYSEVEERLGEEPFKTLARFADTNRERRTANGAFTLSLPEIKAKVSFPDALMPLEKELTASGRKEEPDEVQITIMEPLESREMVAEIMIMAGEAVGRFMSENGIPAPFAGQAPPDEPIEASNTLSAMFACRKLLRRTQLHVTPYWHAGLGLGVYSRVTSPLRRYSDLLAHQQLRAFLKKEPLISEAEMLKRMAQGETGALKAAVAERQSTKHWTLVHLKKRGDNPLTGVVVELMDRQRCKIIIPELALDATLRDVRGLELDAELNLRLASVNLSELEARWKIRESDRGQVR